MQATTPSTPSAAAHAGPSFDNLYTHDFARVAVGVPLCRVADPAFNGEQTAQLLREAAADGAAIAAFPELGLAAYTSDDLFHQRPLLDGCEAALAHLLAVSKDLPTVAIVGLPLRVEHRLFNCAVVTRERACLYSIWAWFNSALTFLPVWPVMNAIGTYHIVRNVSCR